LEPSTDLAFSMVMAQDQVLAWVLTLQVFWSHQLLENCAPVTMLWYWEVVKSRASTWEAVVVEREVARRRAEEVSADLSCMFAVVWGLIER